MHSNMSKWSVLLLFSLVSILAATAVGEKLAQPYKVTGKAYCDTCRCGFETNVTTYIQGVVVDLLCYDKSHSRLVYNDTTVTKKDGTFTFIVSHDHGDQYCDTVLRKSPLKHCSIIDPGRSRSRVIVTNANGISTYRRYANNMGFFAERPLPICPKLLKYYLHFDDDQ